MNVGLTAGLKQRRYLSIQHWNTAFLVNFGLGLILFIVFFSTSNWLSIFFDEPSLKLVIQILSINFILRGVVLVHETMFYRKLRLYILTRIRIIAAAVSNTAALIVAFLFHNYWCLVVQTILASFIYLIGVLYYSRLKIRFKFSKEHLMQLWLYGFYVFSGRIFSEFFRQIDVLIIGKNLNLSTLGIYQRGKSFNSFIFKFVGDSINSVSFPFLSKFQNDDDKFFHYSYRSFKLVSIFTLLLCGFIFINSYDIVYILFGQKWLGTVVVIQFLSFSMFAGPTSAILMSMIHAKGKGKIFLIAEIIKGTIFTTTLFIAFLYGLKGILIANVVVLNFFLIIDFYILKTQIQLNLTPYLKNLGANLFAFGISILPSVFLFGLFPNQLILLRLFINTSVFILIYLFIQYTLNKSTVLDAIRLIKSKFQKNG